MTTKQSKDKVKRGKRILMVLDGFYPFDIRVEKEATSLISAGFEVTVVCYRNKGQSKEEEHKGIHIIRTDRIIGVPQKGIADIVRSAFGINYLLAPLVRSQVGEADALHAHDLPVFKTAFSIGKKHGLPVVLDLHENFPEGILTWFTWRKEPLVRLKNRLFFNYKNWLAKEKYAVDNADRIIAVVDEMRERVIRLHGVAAGKFVIVSNTEPKDLYDSRRLPTSATQTKNIVYVGSIGPHRGVDTAIEAMPDIVSSDPEVRLVIVGSGNADTIAHLKELASNLGVRDQVEFTGQLPYEDALQRMVGALLNIIPHHSNGQNESTIPHKLFQIFLSGYPMMVSSCAPLKRIVGDNGAGVVFEAGNPTDFSEKVMWALENRDALEKMTERGKELVLEGGYDWASDADRLVTMYDKLIN